MIIYHGPSMIDGSNVVAIVTGIDRPSKNPKTGPMAQLWILPADEHPLDAIESGNDASVCGDCPLRGFLGKKRGCYVNVGQAPSAIWKAWKRGSYPDTHPHDVQPKGRVQSIRLGAYGDPGALPVSILDAVTAGFKRWTGYTHQWRKRPELAEYCMASVESDADARTAQAHGWRTFSTAYDAPNSITCANESNGVSCADCGLCDGTRSGNVASITITPHGKGAKYV